MSPDISEMQLNSLLHSIFVLIFVRLVSFIPEPRGAAQFKVVRRVIWSLQAMPRRLVPCVTPCCDVAAAELASWARLLGELLGVLEGRGRGRLLHVGGDGGAAGLRGLEQLLCLVGCRVLEQHEAAQPQQLVAARGRGRRALDDGLVARVGEDGK
ncbi:hypothetical protein T492DRAFT_430248 [Pavlovales sp. CCMP2436]|nr:hypothetical protein T492DRAFT_430248 [Pavlovales sp. CCMP2436]